MSRPKKEKPVIELLKPETDIKKLIDEVNYIIDNSVIEIKLRDKLKECLGRYK